MHRLAELVRGWLTRFMALSPRGAKPPVVWLGYDDLLRELAEAPYPDVIRRIVPYVFSKHPRAAAAALESLVTLMEGVPPHDLPRLEEVIRTEWRHAYGEPRFVEAALLAPGGSSDAAMLGLLSFHPDGYVREAAVRQLAALRDGAELPFLLLRLTDWVRQVRIVAGHAVVERIREEYISAFARNFSLVERAGRAQRPDVASLTEPVAKILETAASQAAMVAALESESRQTARALARFAIDHVPAAHGAVVASGVTSRDAVIRTWVTPLVVRSLPAAEALAILQRLTTNSCPAVRREALSALAGGFPDEAQQHLERAVLDPSPSVRERSRFLLRGRQLDFAARYRAAIAAAATTRLLASGIAGLFEVGTNGDAELAAGYLSHPSASVRRAAVKCMMRLDGEAFAERVAPMLHDPSRGVSAAARDGLRMHAWTLGRSLLTGIFVMARSPHAKLNVVPLFAALPKWESVICLLGAATVPEDEVASLAQRYLRAWNKHYNRSQTVPSRSELEELTAALAGAGTAVDRHITDEIWFALRSFA